MTYDSPLRHDRAWHLREIAEYVAESRPDVFIEPFRGGATTIALLLDDGIQAGIIVESNPYIAAFWQEAIHSDAMLLKVCEFRATEANVQSVVDNPGQDRAFWTLVKSQCSWQGRSGSLEVNGYLEWDVLRRWEKNLERLLISLTQVRSLADRLKIIEGDGHDILKKYDTATAYVRPPRFRPRDEWLEKQKTLFQTLAARNGRWVLDYYAPTPFWMESPLKEWSGIGEVWRVPVKLSDPPFCHGLLVSDRQFASDRNKSLPQAEPIWANNLKH
jgi:hypothetical protein